MCAATRVVLPEAQLIRFVAGPDQALVPDLAARLPGRGVWVRASREALHLARKKGVFARGLKATVRVSDGLEAEVEALLAARALDLLGLAKRAGALAFGARQVEEALRAKPVFCRIEASDGSQDGRERLSSLSISAQFQAPPIVGCFSAGEIGMALGRDRVVHVCVLQERMAHRWMEHIHRLAGFRAIVPASWRPDAAAACGDSGRDAPCGEVTIPAGLRGDHREARAGPEEDPAMIVSAATCPSSRPAAPGDGGEPQRARARRATKGEYGSE